MARMASRGKTRGMNATLRVSAGIACILGLSMLAGSAQAGDPPAAPTLRAELLALVPGAWGLEELAVAEADDAAPLLLQASQALRRCTPNERVLAAAQLQALARFQSWPAAEGGAALASWLDEGGQQGALLLLEKALARPALRCPADPGEQDRQTRALRADGDLLRMAALRAAASAQPDQAAALLQQLLRLVALVRGSARSAPALMAAVSLEGQALRTVVAVCARTELRVQDQLALRETVGTAPDGSLLPAVARAVLEDLIATLPENYEDGRHWSEDLLALQQQSEAVRARLAADQGRPPSPPGDHRELQALGGIERALDRRSTFATVLTWLIEVGEARPKSYQEWLIAMRSPTALRLRTAVGLAGRMLDLSGGALDTASALTPDAQQAQAEADFARLLAGGPNPVGAIIADAHLQAGATLVRFLIERRAARELCTTALDLIAASRLSGSWPTALDGEPRDPFDGQPLRWNPALGLLWSVGRDLVDNGGDPHADIVMELRPLDH